MKIKEYRFTQNFKKAANKYSPKTKKLIARKIDLFVADPFSLELKTHPLSGKLNGYYSFSVNYSIRIMLKFTADNMVEFIKIGTHEIYK